MLKKMISIRNVGRFRDAVSSGDVEFMRSTLIFAENARGKTTLCAVLRSLGSGNPGLMRGRTTLGQAEVPEVNIRLEDGNALFGNGAWSQTVPDIAVFDSAFISENVSSGDAVGLDQRRNLYRVIIGREGVALAEAVDDADAASRAQNPVRNEAKARVEGYKPQNMGVDDFVVLEEEEGVDAKITEKEQQLKAAEQADAIRNRAGFTAISAPELADGFLPILSRTLESVAAEAEQQISEHIAKHEMGERGEPWLSEGLTYAPEDECPFCGQDLQGVDLIASYRAFFSEAYHAFRAEISEMREGVEADFSDRNLQRIETVAAQNSGTAEFWAAFCTFDSPTPDSLERVAEACETLRAAALELIRRKEQAPLDVVDPGATFADGMAGYEQALEAVNAYNNAVERANEAITAKRRETEEANVALLQNELVLLQAIRKRWNAEVREACEGYTAAVAEKTRLEAAKDAAKERLDAYAAEVMGAYEQSINHYLDRFNAGFRITRTQHSYTGGRPGTSYHVEINETAVPLGEGGALADEPCFGNTLSSGDRSTLALAFFLTQLERDPERESKIVVLDDPFNSQDEFRRSHTIYQIRRCTERCAQVIVLSHDRNFLKLIWDELPPAECKTIQLIRMGRENTRIVPWDIAEVGLRRYAAEVQALNRYYAANEGEPLGMIRHLRPVLESWVRRSCPGEFGANDWLGDMLGAIRDAGEGHSLYSLYEDLDEINGYSARYHHGEDPAVITEDPINDNELKGYVKRALELVGY